MLYAGIVSDGFMGSSLVKVTPVYLDSAASSSGTATTSASVTLMGTRNAGDLLLMFIDSLGNTGQTVPSGWLQVGFVLGIDSSAYDLAGRIFARVVDGSESSPVSVAIATSSTWSAVVIRVQSGTYTLPRGGHKSVFDYMTKYNNTSTEHPPLSPNWGGENALWISMLAREVSTSSAPTPAPFSLFNVRPTYSSGTIPEVLVSGESSDVALSLPFTPTTYSRSTYDSTGTVTFALRGNWVVDRPIVFYQGAAQNTAPQTSFKFSASTGALSSVSGDLQLVLIMMYGANSVTITPPSGYTIVRKYGDRLALYKRVIDGSESYPQTWTFSSAVEYLARTIIVQKDTFDAAASVVTAESAFSSTNSVNYPSVASQSGWGGLKNYALHVAVRDGIGEYTGYEVNSWPSAAPENRWAAFTAGVSGADVSHAICGRMIDADSVGSITIGYAGSAPGEAMTIFIKGI